MALKELLTDLNSFYQNFPLHDEFKYGAGTKAANGTFDQKSKKFGQGTASDQPKGGFSNQPYITVDIPEGDDNYSFPLIGSVDGGTSNVLNIINTVSDGFIRGGLITATARSATDVVRLSKFGIDLTRGPEFIAKQIALQRGNVKFEAPLTRIGQSNNRIYNLGINTIAQAGINASGLHFKRQGLFPQLSRGLDDPNGYANIVNTNNSENNRLVSFKNSLAPNGLVGAVTGIVNLVSNFSLGNLGKTEKKELYSYSGGPGSVYGIGRTTIFSYENTLDNDKLNINEDTGKPSHTPGESNIKYPLKIDAENIGIIYPSLTEDPTSIIYTTKTTDNKLKIGEDTGKPSHTVSEGDIKYPLKTKAEEIDISYPPLTEDPTSINYTTKTADFELFGDNGTPKHTPDPSKFDPTDGANTKNYPLTNIVSGLYGDTNAFPDIDPLSPEYRKDIRDASQNNPPPFKEYTTGTAEKGTTLKNIGGVQQYTVNKRFGKGEDALNKGKHTPKIYNYLSMDSTSRFKLYKKYHGRESKTLNLNQLEDFRRVKANQGSGDPTLKSYYQKVSSNYGQGGNIESRLGIGTGFDEMNRLPIIRTAKNPSSKTDQGTRDLIKFYIEAVDNDNPSISDYLFFRAFLTSFKESYNGGWKSFNFVGNPEKFYNYTDFDRGVDLGFIIAAQSVKDLRPLYVKLNALISNLMPDYKEFDTKARGSYIKLTIGSYLDRMPGFIESLSISWDKNYPWEIGIVKGDGNIARDVQVLPHVLNISMKFKPVHNFVPKKMTSCSPNTPFITLNTRVGTGTKGQYYIGGNNPKNGNYAGIDSNTHLYDADEYKGNYAGDKGSLDCPAPPPPPPPPPKPDPDPVVPDTTTSTGGLISTDSQQIAEANLEEAQESTKESIEELDKNIQSLKDKAANTTDPKEQEAIASETVKTQRELNDKVGEFNVANPVFYTPVEIDNTNIQSYDYGSKVDESLLEYIKNNPPQ
jgi:hypothetical protein